MSTIFMSPYRYAGFAPTDIAGCNLWLGADKITGLSGGDSVGTWGDLSGNNHDVSQSTEANKPIYQTNQANGLPVVRFDGTNDGLSTSSSVSFSGPSVSSFIVAKLISAKSFGMFLTYGTSGAGSLNHRTVGTTGRMSFVNGQNNTGGGENAASPSGSSSNLVGQGFKVLSGSVTDNDVWTVWEDGAQMDSRTSSFTLASSGIIHIGERSGTFRVNADIAEVIVYDGALSAADRLRVETYLLNKYGL